MAEIELGENITTDQLDLAALPVGAILKIGSDALVALTGLRNPCGQIDGFEQGLLAVTRYHDDQGRLVQLAGVMAVVVLGGTVRPGDEISVLLPPKPHRPLERV